MDTQMIDPKYTIISCVWQPRDLLAYRLLWHDLTWSQAEDAHSFLVENKTQRDQRPNLPRGDSAAGIVPLTPWIKGTTPITRHFIHGHNAVVETFPIFPSTKAACFFQTSIYRCFTSSFVYYPLFALLSPLFYYCIFDVVWNQFCKASKGS